MQQHHSSIFVSFKYKNFHLNSMFKNPQIHLLLFIFWNFMGFWGFGDECCWTCVAPHATVDSTRTRARCRRFALVRGDRVCLSNLVGWSTRNAQGLDRPHMDERSRLGFACRCQHNSPAPDKHQATCCSNHARLVETRECFARRARQTHYFAIDSRDVQYILPRTLDFALWSRQINTRKTTTSSRHRRPARGSRPALKS